MNVILTMAALVTAEGFWGGNLGPKLVGAVAGAAVALAIWNWKKNQGGKGDAGD